MLATRKALSPKRIATSSPCIENSRISVRDKKGEKEKPQDSRKSSRVKTIKEMRKKKMRKGDLRERKRKFFFSEKSWERLSCRSGGDAERGRKREGDLGWYEKIGEERKKKKKQRR